MKFKDLKIGLSISGVLLSLLPIGVSQIAHAEGAYGADTCIQGYVWREAFNGDHVCVTPQTRSQAAYDNSQAAKRRQPGGGAYGSDTCMQGYVWREASPTDHVCVTPTVRAQAANDNSQAAARKESSTHGQCTAHLPYGLIGEKWQALGAAKSPLGCPLTDEANTQNGKGRYVQFQNGQIVFSPNTGPKSIQVGYKSGNRIAFSWGDTSPFNYDKFIVRWDINGRNEGQQDIFGSRTSGTFSIPYDQNRGKYSISMEGCDNGNFGSFGHSICRQGWSNPVFIGVGTEQPPVQHPTISVSNQGTGTSSVFTVTGSQFLPNHTVTIRVVDDALHTLLYHQSSTANGQLNLRQSISCNSGLALHFSATDGRSDSQDLTGNLWSNTFTISCP